MKSNFRDKLINTVLIILIVIYPFFFRLDYSKSNYEFFDIISIVPLYSWIYLLSILFLLSYHVFVNRRIGLLHTIVATFLIWGLFSISQYPSIVNGDVLIQGGAVKRLIVEGHIHETHGTHSSRMYSKWWPGNFILWATLSMITDINVLDTNYVLVFLNQLILAFLLFLLSRHLLGRRWAGVGPILYFVTYAYGYNYMGRVHFVVQSLGFTFFLYILFLLQKESEKVTSKRSYLLMTLITISVLIVTHGLTSFMVLSAFFGFIVVGQFKNTRILKLIILIYMSVSFFSWWIFNSPFTFESTVSDFSYSFRGSESYLVKLSNPVVTEPLPFVGYFLRTFYFKPLLFLVGLISLVVLLRQFQEKKITLFSTFFIGTIFGSTFALCSPTFAVGIQLSEILMVLTLFSSFLAAKFFIKNETRAKFSTYIFLILILPSMLNMFTYHVEYESIVHSWETYSLSFLSNKSNQDLIKGGDSATMGFYSFYDIDYVVSDMIPNLYFSNYTKVIRDNPRFFLGTIIIRSLRQTISYNEQFKRLYERQAFWSIVDSNLSEKNNKFYDNGFMQFYL